MANPTTIYQDIHITKGDTYSFGVTFEGLNGDLDGAKLSCSEKFDTGVYLFQSVLNNGIVKVSDGVYRVTVSPSMTNNVAIGAYYYDMQITIGTEIYTILKGRLYVDWEVTKP